MADDNNNSDAIEDDNIIGLHSLLTHTINDWGIIHRYIKRHPLKARERYYRNESPLQLGLRARERRNRVGATERAEAIGRMHVLQALVDADPSSIHSRDSEGKCMPKLICLTL